MMMMMMMMMMTTLGIFNAPPMDESNRVVVKAFRILL
jgi:hypothetical protein